MYRYLFPSVAAPTEAQARKLLKGIFPHLWWCSHEPFEQFKKVQLADADMRDYEPGETAHWLWPKIIRRARYVCSMTPDLKEVKIHGKPAFRFRDDLILVCKKLTWRRQKDGTVRLCRSNYKTPTNEDFWAQKGGHDHPDLPRLVLGTVLEREATRVRTVVGLPEPYRPYMDWFFTIQNQAAHLGKLFKVRRKDLEQEQERKGFTIIPVEEEKDSKEEGGDSA